MTWNQFWAWFEILPISTQEDLLLQINLPEFLLGLSNKYKYEVLENAPGKIKDTYINMNIFREVFK